MTWLSSFTIILRQIVTLGTGSLAWTLPRKRKKNARNLYHARPGLVNFSRGFWVPVALRRLEANLGSLRERAMRWGTKDVQENSSKMTACGISKHMLRILGE